MGLITQLCVSVDLENVAHVACVVGNKGRLCDCCSGCGCSSSSSTLPFGNAWRTTKGRGGLSGLACRGHGFVAIRYVVWSLQFLLNYLLVQCFEGR